MFFDFSKDRIFPLLLTAAILFAGIVLYVRFDSQFQPEERGRVFLTYSASSWNYWWNFKFPEQYRSLAAAVGLGIPPLESPQQTPPVQGATARSIPVLLYHGESEAGEMPLPVFVSQLKALKAAGWQTITMNQFTDYMKSGIALPDKSFLLTFDDGRKDTYYPADPVLKDLGYTAVMFVITGFSLDTNQSDPSLNSFYLTPLELQQMASSGRWDLESHGDQDHRVYDVPTATSTALSKSVVSGQHFMSNFFWLPNKQRLETTGEYISRVTNDLTTAKEELQKKINVPISSYAYPFNDFGQDTINFLGAEQLLDTIVPSIYTFAFYQVGANNSDTFNYANSNTYLIKRIEPKATWSPAELLSTMEDGRAKTLPYTATSFGTEWVSTWGAIKPTSAGKLVLTTQHTTGAAAFLNGSTWWQDYKITMTTNWQQGHDVALIARHTDLNQTYLVCALSEDHIFLERHLGSDQKMLASDTYSFGDASGVKSATTFSMSVRGNTATCSAYGKTIEGTFGPEISQQGGVGIEIWDPKKDNALMTVSSVTIDPL